MQQRKYHFNIFCIGWLLLIVVFFNPDKLKADATPEILGDYYWGSREFRSKDKFPPPPLRSNLDKEPQALTCDSEILQIICFNKCGQDYSCEKNVCKCPQNGETLKVTLRFSEDSLRRPPPSRDNVFGDNKYLYSDENDMPPALRTAINEDRFPLQSPTVQLEDLLPAPPRPALRHHIAHFCPSIKKAKECIRTCMKKGLPAFCGKDHVCYCGHRYSSHDNKTKADVNEVYYQFKDIYEKYFGPRIFDQEESADEEE